MDVNEYYRLMGHHSESDEWEMPVYNQTINGKPTPITGPARKPAQPTGELFKAPRYNDDGGHPIINNNKASASDPGAPVYRPSAIPGSGMSVQSAGLTLSRRVYLNCNFLVEVPGYSMTAGFTKVSGLESELELEEVEEGGFNGTHFFPKNVQHPKLVLEYGTSSVDSLKLWFSQVKLGMMIHLPILIIMMDQSRTPVNSWMVMNALPVKYVGPAFDSMSSEVAITRMEFIYSSAVNIPVSISGLLPV